MATEGTTAFFPKRRSSASVLLVASVLVFGPTRAAPPAEALPAPATFAPTIQANAFPAPAATLAPATQASAFRSPAAAAVAAPASAATLAPATRADPSPAPVAPATSAPPVDDLIKEALSRSPSLASLRAQVEAARRMTEVPGLPDPMLDLILQDAGFPSWTVGSQEMSMVDVELSQKIPGPGKIARERAVDRAAVGTEEARLEQARRSVALEIRTLYARLYANDRERESILSGRALMDGLEQSALGRYRAGAADEEAVLKAQLSASRLAERESDLDAERIGLVAGLNRILDRAGDAPLGTVDSLPAPAPLQGSWDSLGVSNSAAVQEARQETTVAGEEAQLERARLRPDFTVGAGIGLRGSQSPVATFRLGFDLPLWERHRLHSQINAADLDREARKQDERQAEAEARSSAARLAGEWKRSEEQTARYRDVLIPESEAALRAARASFVAGRGDFTTVIEDFEAWLDAQSDLAKRESERFISWAELDALTTPAPAPERAEPRGR